MVQRSAELLVLDFAVLPVYPLLTVSLVLLSLVFAGLMRQLFLISWMETVWKDGEITRDYRNANLEARILVT